jgi:hypothetical protein
LANTKYGDHLIPAEIMQKEGEEPAFRFSAASCGVNASWVLLPITTLKPSARELPTHSHNFHQFMNWFGADLADISEFKAEGFTCLGVEQERHIIDAPTIQNLPPGTPHGPGGWLKLEKPIYQFDVFFAGEWKQDEVTVLDIPNGQTEGTKYSKHLIPAPIDIARIGPPVNDLPFTAKEYGVDAGWFVLPVMEPRVMQEDYHKHDFPQFFCYLGSNPKNLAEFDAEIEVYLGEEGEKHVITSPTILYISPGLIHCPMIYKKVNKPVLHLDIYFSEEYVRILAPR